MDKKPSQEEMKEMIKGKEPQITMEFHFIEEEKATITVVNIKKGFIQDKSYDQFINDLAMEIGTIVNCVTLAAKDLSPRKEDVGNA